MKKRYLALEDGTVFEGYAFGAEKESIGELVFNTNVVGYIETLTDPTYYGQIVLQTFPLIGNYGIIESDFIGESKLSGYVVREWCEKPANFRCEYDIDKFLKDKEIPGIYGVDTRELTNIIRSNGSMNAIICDELPADFDAVKSYKIVDAVKNTGSTEVSVYLPKTEIKKHIALALALPVLVWLTVFTVKCFRVEGECKLDMLDVSFWRGYDYVDLVISCGAVLRSCNQQ